MNYADKRKEFDQHNPAPTLFVRFPDSQTGHNEPVLKPRHSSEFDYEGELAVIIGKGGENISRDDALRHVAGYSCYMDGSARDWQHTVHRREKLAADRGVRPVDGDGGWIPDPHSTAIRTAERPHGAGGQHQQHDPQGGGTDRVYQHLHPSQPGRRDHHRLARWRG